MNLRKAFNIFSYSKTVYLILFISFSNAELDAKYSDGTSTDSRKKYSLTAICVEIKPSSPHEEPYLMCKRTKFPYFQNTIYGFRVDDKAVSGSNTNLEPDVQIQPFQYFHNYHYDKKHDIDRPGLESQIQNKSLVLFKQNKQIHVRHLQSSQTKSDISDSAPKTPYDLQLLTTTPSLYRRLPHNNANKNPSSYPNSNNKYIENNNSKQSLDSRITQKEGSIRPDQLFQQSTISSFEGPKSNYVNFFDYRDSNIKQNVGPVEAHSSPYIKTTVPKYFLEVLPSNDDTKEKSRQRGISDDCYRQAVNENSRRLSDLGLTLQELNYIQPSPEFNGMKQFHMEPHKLPYADDPVTQKFYNSLYYPPLMTTKHRHAFLENPICAPLSNHMNNIEPQYSTELHSTCIPKTLTPMQGATKSGPNQLRNEEISEPIEPSNNYYKTCLPETRLTLHPILIAPLCYNRLLVLPSPLSLISSENQYLNRPETTEFVALPNSPLGGLLGSTRPKQPRNSKTSAGMSERGEQKTPPVIPQISPRQKSEDISEISQLDDMQTTAFLGPTTTTRPAEEVVSTTLKSIEAVEESVKESTTSEESQIGNLITRMPIVTMKTNDTKTDLQTKDTGEESMKKVQTLLAKARHSQLRNKSN
ncbi:uncharacterized protein LOC128864346 isoform X2 [Anastrepha ludens]|uniref:uncharacterized protein LOC128864346 isoform X2 n=1 Tax=Anastrepha ludens TaxID=28586 RepID=UPI0023B0F65C|nr:uncharacterized protein LOC128864346 isoform X2 [Anastrepha ludens]